MKLFWILLLDAHVAFATHSLRTFVIDLDRDPKERWKEVAQAYGAHIKQVLGRMEKEVKKHKVLEKLALGIGKFLPKPYYDEVVGLAKYGKMSLTQGIILQFGYEGTVTCTSIICVDDKNVIWHFRNLDYNDTTILKALVFNADFRKGNRSVYKATTMAGTVGLYTGVRPQGFSITLNKRKLHNSILKNFFSAVIQWKKTGHVWPVGILMRDLLGRKEMDYKKAVKVASTFPLMAPCYIIIGGQEKDEGIVIFRNRKGVDSTRHLDRAKGHWFVLATNSDSKFKDLRYLHTFAALNLMTRQRVTPKNMQYVLMTAKQKITVFSSIMSAKSYTLNSTLPHF